MSYILGAVTLPSPKKFVRQFVETAVEHLVYGGITTKNFTRRKEKYILTFQYLSKAVVNSILSEYELDAVRSFSVDDGELQISATDVLIDVGTREYQAAGEALTENFTLVLSEVK